MTLKSKTNKGFTLIELLIVIGILAVLATVVLLVLNPSQMFKQSRDGKRLSELEAINKALLVYQSFGGSSLGAVNTVYISLPATESDCSDITALPALGLGWVYHCSTPVNYRNINSMGWLPIDFTSVQSSSGSLFTVLPIDPINTVADGLYYTYISGSWALSATLESARFLAEKAAMDNGFLSNRFEMGSELTLNANLPGGGGGICSATGGTVTEITVNDTDYKVHTFTSNGTFEVFADSCYVEVLVVAGGGGGGSPYMGGGGGAGGLRHEGSFSLTEGSYSMVVGSGGAGGYEYNQQGANGENSVFSTITAIGGGGGGNETKVGVGGGSGGGGGGLTQITPGSGTVGQGNDGGMGCSESAYGGGGGGGAGAVGGAGTTIKGGDGGAGLSYSISGTATYYAGGGGAADYSSTGGAGGNGGGGAGGAGGGGANGMPNTGGGGGGAERGGTQTGGTGGSGIVIVRYPM